MEIGDVENGDKFYDVASLQPTARTAGAPADVDGGAWCVVPADNNSDNEEVQSTMVGLDIPPLFASWQPPKNPKARRGPAALALRRAGPAGLVSAIPLPTLLQALHGSARCFSV